MLRPAHGGLTTGLRPLLLAIVLMLLPAAAAGTANGNATAPRPPLAAVVREVVVTAPFDYPNSTCEPANCSLHAALEQFARPGVHLVVRLAVDYTVEYAVRTPIRGSVEIVNGQADAGFATLQGASDNGFLDVDGTAGASVTLRNLWLTGGALTLTASPGATLTLDNCQFVDYDIVDCKCPTTKTPQLIHADGATLVLSGGTTFSRNSVVSAAACLDETPTAIGPPPITAGHVVVRAGTRFSDNRVSVVAITVERPQDSVNSGTGACFVADTAEFEPDTTFVNNSASADGGCIVLRGPLRLVADGAAGTPGILFQLNSNRSVVAAAHGSALVGATFAGPTNAIALVGGRRGDVVPVVNCTFADGARLVVDPPAQVATCATAPPEWRCRRARCVDEAYGYRCECDPGRARANATTCL